MSGLYRSGFSGPDEQGRLQLLGQNAVLNFFAREFVRLQREWRVTLDEQLENRTMRNIERVEPRFQITSSGVQWHALKFRSPKNFQAASTSLARARTSASSMQTSHVFSTSARRPSSS